MELTPRINDALQVAAIAHDGHTRKGSDLPYISHPYAVMTIAARARERDEDTLVACLLHDVLEDVPHRFSRNDMLHRFGARVVGIVDGVTKDETISDWHERSKAYLANLEYNASNASVTVSIADKTHNLMSILADYNQVGEAVWERFSADKYAQLWWYRSVLDVGRRRLPIEPLVDKLADLVEELQIMVYAQPALAEAA